MHGMVKLNDLEDMAEPPLNDNIVTSFAASRQHEGTGLEVGARSGMGVPNNFPFSPEDINNGLG